MKTPKMNDELAEKLKEWRVVPRRDPTFRGAVWSRVEAAQGGGAQGGGFGYARRHLGLTAGLTALALVTGAWMGRDRAQTQAEADRTLLAENYVRSLDARTMRMP